MGYLYCRDISKILIDHLKNTGPISIDQAVRKYDAIYDEMVQREHSGEFDDSELGDEYKRMLGKRYDDWEIQQGMACEYSVFHYMSKGLIEPAIRGALISVMQLWCSTNITAKDEIKLFIKYASVEEMNGVIGEAANYVDESCSWFDNIVWKMTDKARKRPRLLKPFDGVDL